jgi:hypothetical protein
MNPDSERLVSEARPSSRGRRRPNVLLDHGERLSLALDVLDRADPTMTALHETVGDDAAESPSRVTSTRDLACVAFMPDT